MGAWDPALASTTILLTTDPDSCDWQTLYWSLCPRRHPNLRNAPSVWNGTQKGYLHGTYLACGGDLLGVGAL